MDAIVEKYIKNDRRKADLFHRLGADNTHGRVPNSGMGEEDYRSEKEAMEAFGVPLMRQDSYQSFPAEVQEHIKRMQSNFATGLLSMISRAWVSIDCDLYLWNFELSCDVVYFDRINSTILTAGVTIPCTTLPQPQPDAILTVITTTDVVLIGLNFRDSAGRLHPPGFKDFKSADAQLVGRVLHQVPLEGLIVNSLCCSKTGRIFFTADSSLYELDYYSKTWYGGSRCTVINHSKGLFSYLLPVLSIFHAKDAIRQLAIDDTRHLLYVLFEKGGVQVFDLGEDGMSTQKFGMLHHEQIEADATRDCNVATEYFREIVSLCVVPSTQSAGVNFFVVTSKGVRIYFACSDPMGGAGQITQEQVRPKYFRIVHVRFPPSPFFSTRDIEVYLGQSADDFTFMASTGQNDGKVTTLRTFSSSELWNFSRPVEHVAAVTIPKGPIWEIDQPRQAHELRVAASSASVPTLKGPSVTDHSERFFVLTPKGIYAYHHVSTYELFRRVLADSGPESRQFKCLLVYLDPVEICFMALTLLCGYDASDGALKDKALQIFFIYGGEPRMQATAGRQPLQVHPSPIAAASSLQQFDTSLGNISGISSLKSPLHTSTPRAQQQNGLRTDAGRVPISLSPDFSTTPQAQLGGTFAANVVPSARHEALFVYFARIVSAVWDRKICNSSPASSVNSSIGVDEVNDVVMPLSAFLKAFEEYPLISPTPSQYSLMSAARHIVDTREGNLMEQERQSMVQLKFTAKMTLEVIRLWGILLDHQFQTVISMTSPELRNVLPSITFGDLVERRESFCAELITSLMRFYISDEASTSAISNRLRDSCPSLFTKDDALVVRATDNLYKSKSIQSVRDRTRLVNEAVSTLQKSIHRHLFRDVMGVCDLLLQVHNFLGIVDLAIARAEKDDPGRLALIAYKKHQVSDGDEALSEAMKKRNEAYACITEVLSLLRAVELSERDAAFPAINLGAAASIFPSASSVKSLTPAEAEGHRRAVLQRVFESDDELANVAVFHWLLSHNLFEVPIEFRCRFFESFLRREIAEGKGARYMELLWKFYEKSGDYVSAAKTLYEISVIDGRSKINLAQRVTYLSHALMCIQAAEESKSSLELKGQISDQLDVARVQQKTRSAIESLAGRTINELERREAIDALDSYLYNLTDLYEKFADHFDLQEVKLAILRCAGLGEEAISDFGG